MAWELERLIARLLMFIACAGEEGCSVSDFVDVVRSALTSSEGISYHDEWDSPQQHLGTTLSNRGIATIWEWIVRRDEISVGPDKKYNHLSLGNILGLAESSITGQHRDDDEDKQALTRGKEPASRDIRIYASEESMWEVITGHPVDYKRVPRSEWLLLLGIASKKDQGILQGDLGRLVDQDKRSVPKRTDALVKKGYITKRTTLVRGTKTSKLWLKSFTPSMPRDMGPVLRPEMEMNLCHHILAANLDPVPWHTRWTGESVDYTALAITIMATCKEWVVMRLQDLKAKLGVLGMRWQMKVVSKVCRFLNARDAIRYVAAKLDNKVYKDCIRFNRDLDTEDWSIFLATGKRPGKSSRFSETFIEERNERTDLSIHFSAGASWLHVVPSWSMDQPLPITVAKAIMESDGEGLTNTDVYSITLGGTFTRFLSSMTTVFSTPGIQPPHLKHLQVKSEHLRVGKVASYRYSIQKKTTSTSSSLFHVYNLPFPQQALSSAMLTDLCKHGIAQSKKRGRPKIRQWDHRSFDRIDDAHEQNVQNWGNDKMSVQSQNLQTTSRETSAQSTAIEKPQGGGQTHSEKVSLMVCLRISPNVLQACLSGLQPCQNSTRSTEELASDCESKSRIEAHYEDAQFGDSKHTEARDAEPPISGRGRDGGRGRGKWRGRGRGRRVNDGNSKTKEWDCSKCGGSWKNDIGLKYHLEKSKTSCNPSWNLSVESAHRRRLVSSPDGCKSTQKIPILGQERRSQRKRNNQENDTMSPCNRSESLHEGRRGGEGLAEAEVPKKTRRNFEPDRMAQCSSFGLGLIPLCAVTIQPRHIRDLPARPDRLNETTRLYESPSILIYGRSTSRTSPGVTMAEESVMTLDPGPLPLFSQDDPRQDLCFEERDTQRKVISLDSQQQKAGSTHTGKKSSQKRAPTQKLSDRISDLVIGMLWENSGVLPGGESLWHALGAVWTAKFPTEPIPKLKDCQWALSRMLKKKLALEHWHGFQGHDSLFSKCQIITLPHIGPFSPQSLSLLDKIKQDHPRLFVPPMFAIRDARTESQGKIEPRRGRRLLAGEVADLNAPVYAAQVAAKRGPDDCGDTSHTLKRRRCVLSARKSFSNVTTDRQNAMRANETRAFGLELPYSAEENRFSSLGGDSGIQILASSTFGSDKFSNHSIIQGPEGMPQAKRKGDEADLDPRLFENSLEGTIWAKPTNSVLGSGRSGSALESNDVENVTMRGSMPGGGRFSWDAMSQYIEKRALLNRKRVSSSVHKVVGPQLNFKERLKACLDLEMMWTISFSRTQRLAAGPHTTFINFTAGPNSLPLPDLVWVSQGQLNTKSAGHLLQDATTSYVSLRDDDEEYEDDDSYDDDDDDGDGDGYGMTETQLKAMQQSRLSLEISEEKAQTKRVALTTRALNAIPQGRTSEAREQLKGQDSASENKTEILAAFIAVRVLLGGADKAVDWGLLVNLFPQVGLEGLRRFWSTVCKEQALYVKKFIKAFQAKVIEAFENNDLPIIDFSNLLGYDWPRLIRWTVQIPRQEGFQIPQTRQLLDSRFMLEEVRIQEEDWREKFFHVQSSIFSRFEAVTLVPGVVVRHAPPLETFHAAIKTYDVDVARSWIKSLCCTENAKFSGDQIKDRFLTLSDDAEQSAMILKAALDSLTRERVICKSKKPPFGGRPYRLSEWYMSTLNKICQRSKYHEAAAFKAHLDATFRLQGELEIPYTLDDGATMALTNLNAAGRIRLVLVDVPDIPFGFEPGNYESRKFPKSYYHFPLKAVPTERYAYNEEIKVLEAVLQEDLPSASLKGEIPQWVDFSGDRNVTRWSEILGAFCFTFATRGSMSVEGVCCALNPVLEEFEARLIVDWGRKTGVIEPMTRETGITVGEWWWLAVPWQLEAA